MNRHDHVVPSAIEAIGETPLVELARLGRDLASWAEYLNPGFSKKDRIARQIIEDAEADGRLRPGQTVVELTSGNTGTGLTIVCGIKGYPFVAVMSKGNSMERARMMRALGAEVVLVDQAPGSVSGQVSGDDLALVEQETQRIVEARGAFRADQFRLDGNTRAHYLHTGPEILRQTGGRLDAFCDFAGTGGSFSGCAAAFKEHNPAIGCFVVEPEGAAALKGELVTNPGHRIQGGGYSMGRLINRAGGQLPDGPRLGRRDLGPTAGQGRGSCGLLFRRERTAAVDFCGVSGQTIVVMMCASGLVSQYRPVG
jgi:cysteine synthase A